MLAISFGRTCSYARAGALAAILLGTACRSQPAASRLFISNESGGTISVIDAQSSKTLATIPVGNQPRGLRVSRDGRTLFVALAGRYAYVTTGHAGSVAVIDLQAHRLARVIEHVGHRPSAITLGRDGLLYTANGPNDDIAAIDPASGVVVRRIASGGSPWGITSL